MTVASGKFYTPDEYLERELTAETKSEYYGGEIFAMAQKTYRHVRIVSNALVALATRLAKPCFACGSDLRIATASDGLYTYPDISIICGEPAIIKRYGESETALNPIVLVEVLSDSTEAYNRGTKFALYRQIETLKEYVLVLQHSPTVEVFERQSSGNWLLRVYDTLEAKFRLKSLGVEVPLEEIYREAKLDGDVMSMRRASGADGRLR